MDFVSAGNGTLKSTDAEDGNELSNEEKLDPAMVAKSTVLHAGSDELSDGSEEVILFRGRHRPSRVIVPKKHARIQNATLSNDLESLVTHSKLQDHSVESSPTLRAVRTLEDDILADYIANMASDSAVEAPGEKSETHQASLYKPPDFESFQPESVEASQQSATIPTITEAIVGPIPRNRRVGESVIGRKHPPEELEKYLEASGDVGATPVESEDTEDSGDSADSQADSEEQAMQDLLDAFRSEEIEDRLLQARQQQMTDEQIAQRLAKQEELGLDSSQVLLFDGHEVSRSGTAEEDPEAAELEQLRQEAKQYMSQAIKGKGRRSALREVSDLEGDFEGDDYGDFDVMDRERASLQVRGKKRKGENMRYFCDSEVEAQLQLAWEKDRSSKKARKQQRELLRKEGGLGKHAENDMWAKYPNGMAWDQIREEMRDFMLSHRET